MAEVLQPPDYLSASSMTTFLQCPLKFKFSRIDRIKEPATEPMILGSFVHEILEEFYKASADERTFDTARSIGRDLWDSKWAKEADEVGVRDINQFRWKAWWCIENLFTLEDPQQMNLAGVETKVDDTINGVRVLGFVDRYLHDDDGNVVVADYKTGKVPLPKWSADKVFQIMVYVLMLEQMLEQPVVSGEIIYLKEGKVVAYEPTQKRRSETIQTITSVRKEVEDSCEAGAFQTKPSRLCDWCHYKPICPAWAK